MGRESQEWQLCYNKTTDGPPSAATFHQYCNYRGPTMTIIRLSNGRTFGGFTTANWSATEGYTTAENSFIFSLANFKPRYMIARTEFTTFNKDDYGPTFGGGHDFHVIPF